MIKIDFLINIKVPFAIDLSSSGGKIWQNLPRQIKKTVSLSFITIKKFAHIQKKTDFTHPGHMFIEFRKVCVENKIAYLAKTG